MIEQNLLAYLKALGTTCGDRWHIGNATQATAFPVGVINLLQGLTPRTTNGTKLASRATFTIGVIAKKLEDALPVSRDLKDTLDGFKGVFPHALPSLAHTKVLSCRCISEPTVFNEIDGDKTLRAASQDFRFMHVEA